VLHRTRPASTPRAAALILIGLPALLWSDAQVGEHVPDHEFTRLAGHDGRTRLSELHGQPVLLSGWKRHFAEGLHSASLADQLYRSFGEDGLLVVLQDREPWDRDPPWVEDVDFWYRYYGTPLWITESPDGANDPSIARNESAIDVRSLVLIGVDGTLLLERSVDTDDTRAFKNQKKDFERAIKAELRRRKGGWGEDPVARKARGLAFGKGDLSGALRALDGVKAAARVAEHDQVRAELDRHFEARSRSVAYLLDEGRYGDAKDALAELSRSVRGRAPFADSLAPLTERLESDDGRAWLKEDKRLARTLEPFLERELDDLDLDFIRDLRAFSSEREDSPVAARARRLDPLLARVVRILRKISAKDFEARVSDD
jgi:hypothetical protein